MVILHVKDGAIMKIEEINFEDTADANYFIKKFFNNDYKKITMAQLEQLVMTVYSMGKKNGVPTDGAPDESEPESTDKTPDIVPEKTQEKAPAKTNTFKVNDRVRTIEDIEIGRSGEFIKPDKVGIITFIKGDTISVLYEMGEEGEMFEINFLFDKLEKVS
jgi:hypothetical protein